MTNVTTHIKHQTGLSEQTDRLNGLSKLIHQNNKEKGFWEKERNVGEMLMLVVSELGEAIEAHRKNHFAEVSDSDRKRMELELDKPYFQEKIKNSFEDEIADALIRLLDLAGGCNIDLGWHVKQKVTYNTSRPNKHGKQY